jgi:hypothetical protein
MQIMEIAQAPSGNVGETREGIQDSKLLLWGEESTPRNFKFNFSRAVTDWKAPRHKHNFDQFRYVLAGEFVYGDRVLPVGHVAYFPEGIAYGPQIRREGLEVVLCQLGGASGHGFLSKQQRREAKAELEQRGSFDKGVYTWVDAQGQKHNQDSAEAVYEQAVGGKSVYPEPRYNDIIVMNPDAFAWLPQAGSSGVEVKWLGSFNERGTRCGFIRLREGARYDAGIFPGVQLMFLVTGKVAMDGKDYGRHTAFGFEAEEGPIPILGREEANFFCVIGPQF